VRLIDDSCSSSVFSALHLLLYVSVTSAERGGGRGAEYVALFNHDFAIAICYFMWVMLLFSRSWSCDFLSAQLAHIFCSIGNM
jgi:hypothetical protein